MTALAWIFFASVIAAWSICLIGGACEMLRELGASDEAGQ
jgi:hypothetical protein